MALIRLIPSSSQKPKRPRRSVRNAKLAPMTRRISAVPGPRSPSGALASTKSPPSREREVVHGHRRRQQVAEEPHRVTARPEPEVQQQEAAAQQARDPEPVGGN